MKLIATALLTLSISAAPALAGGLGFDPIYLQFPKDDRAVSTQDTGSANVKSQKAN